MKPHDPASFDALMSQGMAASQANESTQAIAWFQEASAAQPTAALPQFLLGAEFAALGDIAQAETAFANATLLAPGFSMARYQLGLLQFSSGRAATALITWQPLLGLPDTDPLPHFVNGFAALAQDRFDEALQRYQKGLALNTTNDALSGDIQKVIAGIKSLSSTYTTADDQDRPTDSTDNHVLLANYQQQGPAH